MARPITLTDDKKRDAQVAFETVKRSKNRLQPVGPQQEKVHLERFIKTTETTSLEALLRQYGSPENVSQALIEGDPEIALDQIGRRLHHAARVFVRQDGSVLYAARIMQVVYAPDGTEKSRQDFTDVPATVGEDVAALPWTGRLLPMQDVVHQFVFSRAFQICHVNGLTFDFLYDIAKKLHDEGKLLYVGSGAKGQGPLIFTLNGTPYRGFLEGRIDGERYLLVLHCANLELKSMGGGV